MHAHTQGILRITKSDFRDPLNLGSTEMVSWAGPGGGTGRLSGSDGAAWRTGRHPAPPLRRPHPPTHPHPTHPPHPHRRP